MDEATFRFAMPPDAREQHRIIEWVIERSDPVVEAMATARRELDLLRKLRTRLIADVVTGQLDVRAAAAALPDEPADDEPLIDDDEPGDDDLDTEADDTPEDEVA